MIAQRLADILETEENLYDAELMLLREEMVRARRQKGRLTREYGHYLQMWFSDGPCDGYKSFADRYRAQALPQSYTSFVQEW